jgi:hypothetical protein
MTTSRDDMVDRAPDGIEVAGGVFKYAYGASIAWCKARTRCESHGGASIWSIATPQWTESRFRFDRSDSA